MKSTIIRTYLEKAAHDNGFDLEPIKNDEWLVVRSSRCPLVIWLYAVENGNFALAVSDAGVGANLGQLGKASLLQLPAGACSVVEVIDITSLYLILKRAFQLSRSLPSEPLIEFQKRTLKLPKSTEVERMVIQRVGQEIFRERLFEFWDGKCVVSGLAVGELLRASHIKPWKDCSSDHERLDVYNGLLLAPHFDAAFDRGFISFADNGAILVSCQLGTSELKLLGIDHTAKISGLTPAHLKYINWHREKEFKGN